MARSRIAFLTSIVALWGLGASALGETECRGWGDVRDFRYKGDLIDITSNLRMVSPDETQTAQINNQARIQGPVRAGTKQTYAGTFAFGQAQQGRGGPAAGGGAPAGPPVTFRVQMDDTAPDTTAFDITASAGAAVPLKNMSYYFNIPGAEFNGGTLELTSADAAAAVTKVPLAGAPPGANRYADNVTVKSLRFTGKTRNIAVTFASPTPIVIQENRGGGGRGNGGGGGLSYSVSFPIGTGNLTPGSPFHSAFTLNASCDNDVAPVKLTLDPSRPGPAFVGVGGNFRLQGGQDPAHIAYNLANLRVAWGRVAMPLDGWQTTESADPAANAQNGQINQGVRQAMEMARTLAQKKIPFIISDWSVPAWAAAQGGGGGAGRYIAPDKWPAMYKGIVSYLVYLKKNYNAEPALFSFNEADMGINVHLTPADQDTVIKGLGAAMAEAGLSTKMLLGDTGNPTPKPANYNDPAMNDPEAMKFVGAVSYHSWTGGSDQQLASFAKIAARFKIPCLIAEGGTDPDSYKYNNLFLEPWYALDEMNLYLRCCALSQPTSIIHWQLTENYSVLTGGRNGQPLQPTQRFFNLKQLNLTPPEAPSFPVAVDRPHITAAAYGDAKNGYAFHLINTGATRPVTIAGIPAGVKELYPCITDAARNLKVLAPVPVDNGTLQITLDLQSYCTLTSVKPAN